MYFPHNCDSTDCRGFSVGLVFPVYASDYLKESLELKARDLWHSEHGSKWVWGRHFQQPKARQDHEKKVCSTSSKYINSSDFSFFHLRTMSYIAASCLESINKNTFFPQKRLSEKGQQGVIILFSDAFRIADQIWRAMCVAVTVYYYSVKLFSTRTVRLMMKPFKQLRVEPSFCALCSNPRAAACPFAISYSTPEKGQLFGAFCHMCKNRVM